MNDFKIFAGTYYTYNSGQIFGRWFNFSDYSNAQELYNDILDFHKDETDPEIMIQDYENFPACYYFESMNLSDFEDLYNLIDFAENNGLDLEVITDFISEFGQVENLDVIPDSFYGYYSDFRDFSDQYFNELYLHDVPDNIAYYIDYEKFANDLEYDFLYSDHGYIFNRNW